MDGTVREMLAVLGTAFAAAGALYAAIACVAVSARRTRRPAVPERLPPITVLKPLCGREHSLYECLRSFCEQDYPEFQVVCGVRDADDAAIDTVKKLQREFPELDLELAVDARQHGSSAKVSNLINMTALARHDCFLISDSDVRVPAGYLATVTAALLDPEVGVVTCAYRGVPRRELWPQLGALFINEWLMPGVYVSALFGSRAFAFGATIALRREVLERIGGFASIADQLADDYRLGELTRQAGLRTVLADIVVETCVDEPRLRDLVSHELRWLRTIRSVRPTGYAFSFVTFSVPVAALGSVLAAGSPPALTFLGIASVARLALHFIVDRKDRRARDVFLIPLADLLAFALWCWSFTSRRVRWREARLEVGVDGSAHRVA